MTKVIKYIGLHVHKETVVIAIAEGERGGEVRYLGPVANDGDAIRRLVKRLAGDGTTSSFCYEAGPCGFGLQRLLRAGELDAIWVTDGTHEAVRDLIRARRTAQGDAISAKQSVRSFLLRHDRRFIARSAWTKAYWRWLAEQRFDYVHQ